MRMRQGLYAAVLSALAGLAGAALFYSLGPLLEEERGLHWLFTIRGAVPPPEKVFVVSVDRRSADAFGIQGADYDPDQWSRARHGALIDRLVAHGVAVIVFDVLFTAARQLDEDSAFADAIARAGNVLLAEDRRRRVTEHGDIDQIRMPIPRFAEMAAGTAPFVVPQTNAPVTQVWAFRPEGVLTPTLPVVALQALVRSGQDTWERALREAGSPVIGLTSLKHVDAPERFNLREIAREYRRALHRDKAVAARLLAILDAEVAAAAGATEELLLMRRLADLYQGPESHYVNYYGPPGTIRTLPYASISEGAHAAMLPADDLRKATVFVGVSDLEHVSNRDYIHTVFTGGGVRLSGVELAATMFANMRDGLLLRQPQTASLLLVAAFGFVVCFTVCQLAGRNAVPIALGLGAAYAVGVQLAFAHQQLWLPLAIPMLVQLPLALIAGVSFRYWYTRRTIGQMVPVPPGNVIDIKPVAYTGPATCLIADAEGYTRMVHALGARAARDFMNDYYRVVSRAVAPFSPDFEEFPADNFLYGWFGDDPSRRERACLAALASITAVAAFNAGPRPRKLGLRIGLAVGSVVHGTLGADKHLAYRLVGDPVNAASRAQTLNKLLGSRVLATATVVADLDRILVRRLGDFTLRGIPEPVSIAEILAEKAHADDTAVCLAGRFEHALGLLDSGLWQEAHACFASLVRDYPEDGASRYYLRNTTPDAAQ